jgi:hypothetical protein
MFAGSGPSLVPNSVAACVRDEHEQGRQPEREAQRSRGKYSSTIHNGSLMAHDQNVRADHADEDLVLDPGLNQ